MISSLCKIWYLLWIDLITIENDVNTSCTEQVQENFTHPTAPC